MGLISGNFQHAWGRGASYIRNGLNCVIEQFSIYVFKCCTSATMHEFLENRKNCQKSIISFHFVCSFNWLILKLCTPVNYQYSGLHTKNQANWNKITAIVIVYSLHIYETRHFSNYWLLDKCFWYHTGILCEP